MFCVNCGQEIMADTQKFCPKCGTPVGTEGEPKRKPEEKIKPQKPLKSVGIGSLTSKINHLAGGEGAVDLHLKDLVSGVLKHHTAEEAEALFVCGTSETTPAERDIATEWPKPWLYSRVLFALLATVFMLMLMFTKFGNTKALPNILFIGSLAMPIAVTVFFFEMNAPRNISFLTVIRTFFVGGVLSLLITLLLFDIAPELETWNIYAFIIGIVEETGKALVVAVYLKKHRGKLYLLNGILIGGIVGAGFAVFESAGYAFRSGAVSMVGSGTYSAFYEEMMRLVKLRAFLSPGGHVAWAAVSGFAMVLALKGSEFEWNVLVNKHFLKIYWIPVVLHGIWDTIIFELTIYNIDLKRLILSIAIWIVLLTFIDRGFKEVSEVARRNEALE